MRVYIIWTLTNGPITHVQEGKKKRTNLLEYKLFLKFNWINER